MMLTYCDGASISRLGGCSSWFFKRTRAHESSGIWRYLLRRDFGAAGGSAGSSSVAALMRAQVLPALRRAGRACPRCTLVQRHRPPNVLGATAQRGMLGLKRIDQATPHELAPSIWKCEMCGLPLEELEEARARMKLALVGISRPAEGANELAVGIGRLIDVAFLAMPILKRLQSPAVDDPLAAPMLSQARRHRRRGRRVMRRRSVPPPLGSSGGRAGAAGGAALGGAAEDAGDAAVALDAPPENNDAQPFYAMYFAVQELFALGKRVQSAGIDERLRKSRWTAWRGALAETFAVSSLFPIPIAFHTLTVGVLLWWWAWAPASPCEHVCAAENGTCAADHVRACVVAARTPLLSIPVAVAPFVLCIGLYVVALFCGAAHTFIESYVRTTRVEVAAHGDDAIFVVPQAFPSSSLRSLRLACDSQTRSLPFRRLRKTDELDEVSDVTRREMIVMQNM